MGSSPDEGYAELHLVTPTKTPKKELCQEICKLLLKHNFMQFKFNCNFLQFINTMLIAQISHICFPQIIKLIGGVEVFQNILKLA